MTLSHETDDSIFNGVTNYLTIYFIQPKIHLLPLCYPLHLLLTSVTGKKRDPEDAKNYICKLYEQQAITRDKSGERKTLYPHFTCATDTNNIRRVFSDVKDTVLLKSLRDYGVI